MSSDTALGVVLTRAIYHSQYQNESKFLCQCEDFSFYLKGNPGYKAHPESISLKVGTTQAFRLDLEVKYGNQTDWQYE